MDECTNRGAPSPRQVGRKESPRFNGTQNNDGFDKSPPVLLAVRRLGLLMSFITALGMCNHVLAETPAPVTPPPPVEMSPAEMTSALASLVPPKTSMELIKNIEYAFRKSLFRYEAFYTPANLMKVFGQTEAHGSPLTETRWIIRKEEAMVVRQGTALYSTEPGVCDFDALLGYGKPDDDACWGLVFYALNHTVSIVIYRYQGGKGYAPGCSKGLDVVVGFDGSVRQLYAEVGDYLLQEHYLPKDDRKTAVANDSKATVGVFSFREELYMPGADSSLKTIITTGRQTRLEKETYQTIFYMKFIEEF